MRKEDADAKQRQPQQNAPGEVGLYAIHRKQRTMRMTVRRRP